MGVVHRPEAELGFEVEVPQRGNLSDPPVLPLEKVLAGPAADDPATPTWLVTVDAPPKVDPSGDRTSAEVYSEIIDAVSGAAIRGRERVERKGSPLQT